MRGGSEGQPAAADGEARARLAAIVDSSADAIISNTLDGTITSWNAAAVEMYGYAAEEMIGRSVAELIPPDRHGELADLHDRVRRGRPVRHLETKRVRKDDGVIDVSLSVAPIKDASGAVVGAATVARDATEHHRMEEALRRSEALLNQTQRAAHVGGWEYDVAARRVTWTDETYRIHGVTRDSYDPGEPAQDIAFYSPEDQHVIDDAFTAAVTAGKPYDLELRLVTAQGAQRWVRTSAEAEWRDGQVFRVFGHIVDTTELRKSEELFRSTIDVLQDAFGVLSAVRDDSGQIVDFRAEYANPVGCALFDRPLAQVIGERLLTVLPSMKPLGTFAKLVHTVETGEPTEYEMPWFEEDVLAGAFDVRGAKLGDGIVVTIRDITSRTRAEQELRASEERNRVTMESAAAGMANVGLDGRFRRVNRRFCEISGYSAAELLAQTFQDITRPGGPGSGGGQPRLAAGEIPWYGMERRYLRKDGSAIWVLLTGAALRDEHGQAYEYVVTVTDITTQKQAQEEVNRLNAELEQRVRQRTAELEAANRNLEAFSYTVSHDLRAPLTTLSGFIEMLAEEYGDRLDDAGLDYLARIRASSKRMDDLISDLLALSAASRAEITITEVDLSGLARTTVAGLRVHDPGRQVQVTIADGVQALGDERLLRTVVENLLSNAWKFTSRTPGAAIEFGSLQPADTMIHCVVRDNGAGFDPADAGKLFRPFSRLHSSKDFPGTGVGLASVQRIVERHHGRCWAEGEPGRGATFHFTLPAVQA